MNEESALCSGSGIRGKTARSLSWNLNRKHCRARTISGGITWSTLYQMSKGPMESIARVYGVLEPTQPDQSIAEVINYHRERINSFEISGDLDPSASADDEDGNHDNYSEERMVSEYDTIRNGEGSSEDRVASSSSSHDKLGLVSMVVIIFYSVSGGPIGIEPTVRAGGFFYALLGFFIMPFIWSIQEALMTAELGTAFPEASGGVVWVEEAFGPQAGWMAGYLSWIGGATDNAIYPVLFLDYLLQIVGNSDDDSKIINPIVRFCLLSSTSIILAYMNWRGLALVGKMSLLICVLAMSPFVILIVVGSFKVDPSRWWELPNTDVNDDKMVANDDGDYDTDGGLFPNFSLGGILWRPYLNNLFWCLNSFDSAGCLVAELDSNVSFIRSLMLGLVLTFVCYFFPLLIAIGSSTGEQADWTDGYMATVNAEVVGPWLGAFTVFAAGITNIGLFQAELSGDAFQLMGMADRGYLPKIFSERSKYGTPTYGLVLGTIVIVVMGVSDLDKLIEMLNFNYGFSLLFEYAAFFKLRVSRPDLERPYRIPLSTLGCAIFFFPTVVSTIFVMSLATFDTFYFALGSFAIGYFLYAAGRWKKLDRFFHSTWNSTNPNYESVENEAFEDENDVTESVVIVGAINIDTLT